MTITEFLEARIAEDESTARAAGGEAWTVDSATYVEAIRDEQGGAIVSGGRWGGEASVFDSNEIAAHIVRWNPARVLAECQAKRRLVDLHGDRAEWCGWSQGGTGTHGDMGNGPAVCDTLCRLAAVYADHPDYDPAWRVDPSQE